jgi:hypothetical protein
MVELAGLPNRMAPVCATLEFRLFCLALRRPQGAGDLAALRDGMTAGPEWRRILEAARRHRVAPLLLAGLQACRSPELPPAVVAELRAQASVAAMSSLNQIREVVRLSRIFAHADLRMLALKGVVLSLQLYGDPALRYPRDIDLLVAPDEFAAAEALLIEAGYRRAGPTLSTRQTTLYRRWVKDAGFIHASSGIQVELHHRLSDNPALIPCNFAELWRQREDIEIASTPVATLPRRELGLYLCMHGAGHCWEELQWLVDFAAALRDRGGPNRAIAAAERSQLEVPMLHALMLAHDWLALAVDDRLLARARADPAVARLNRILAHFYCPSTWYRTPQHRSLAGFQRYSVWLRLYTYLLKADWRYWRNQATREFITPADWSALRLPDWLIWLFPVVRPFGWLVRRWMRRC